ncbi:Ger(x)C family spore germination protein [Paenibacillus taichungensis]|uniref:Ger(x)C family spore germination protein n=2 Tax=Paenibacillus taichungensis TaxID=484184 RepID=UPI002DB8E624|nr:Ger(x)C family spore germination protein [Paenibacillus taichungensis]MEC0110508.1 Ger(x)C family spore germination protein [Paenibacillus taichungensis]
MKRSMITPKLIVALMCVLLCSGCWSKVEINERTFITTMYVDKGEKPGEIDISLSMPLPNRISPEGTGGPGKNPYALVSATASTIADAMERIQTDLTRKISWGHTRVVVFGEAYAREGIQDAMEWISREPLFHLSSYVMVAKGRARDVADLTPVFEETPSDVLREFATEENMLKTQMLSVLMADKMNQGFVAPLLESKSTAMASEDNRRKQWTSQVGGALFKQMKMVDSISADETRGIAWANRKLDTLAVSVETEDEKASMTVYNTSSKIKVRLVNGQPFFDITLRGQAELNSVIPILKVKDIVGVKQIEQKANEKVSAHLTDAIRTGQRKKADILMLGYRLEWAYPHIWEQLRPVWNDYVKNELQFKVHAQINIQFVGSESSY